MNHLAIKNILSAFLLLSVSISLFGAEVEKQMQWLSFKDIGVEGRVWNDTPSPYGRIPEAKKSKVTPTVWKHSFTSTGMCVTFETDAKEIWIRRSFDEEKMQGVCFTLTGYCGFDLYAKHDGQFKWLAATTYKNSDADCYKLFATDGKKHVYRIYLPLRNILKSAEVGVPVDANFKAIAPSKEKPIVFYGSSIVHGAYASHAGMSHPSIIGRRLNMPIVNFGFSGAAMMETGMAELLAEIDASVYVIDAQPNMSDFLVKQRCEKFLRLLRKLRPDTPILLVESAQSSTEWYWNDGKHEPEKKWLLQREIFDKLTKEGQKNMLYLRGDNLFGESGEESVDDCHPNDLGFMSMADKMTPLIKKLLQK